MKKIISWRILAAAVIGAALVFVLMRYVAIPSGIPSTYLNMAAVVVAIVSAVFGPLAGFIAAFAGHAMTDFASGYGIWWTWVIADGIFGLLIGCFCKFYKIQSGQFSVKEAFIFNGVQILSNFIAWLAIAPALDVIFYKEAANKVFLQGFVAAFLNGIVVLVLGTILILCYARIIIANTNGEYDE